MINSKENYVILAIKPEFTDKILRGNKRYEFRKKAFKMPVKKIFLYATSPIKKVVGEVKLTDTVVLNKKELWEKCRRFSGVSEQSFNEYYKNKQEGVALVVTDPIEYAYPKSLEKFGLSAAPQSFCYVKNATSFYI